MGSWKIRQATLEDVPAICAIHNQGIEDRVATLDLEPHTLEGKRAWFQQLKDDELVLVYEEAGEVLGFVALTRYSPRKCYDGVGSLSIYIARSGRGRGIGTRLLQELIQVSRGRGYRKIVLLALPFNRAGIALYEKLGFEKVGVHKNHGRLDERWVDILVMELLV